MHYTAPFSAQIGELMADFLISHGSVKKRDLIALPETTSRVQ